MTSYLGRYLDQGADDIRQKGAISFNKWDRLCRREQMFPVTAGLAARSGSINIPAL